MEKVSLKDVGGLLRSQLGGSLMVPSSHYPSCYPSPPSQAWGHNWLEEEEKEKEEKKEEKQEKEKKKVPLPLGTPLHHPKPGDTIV